MRLKERFEKVRSEFVRGDDLLETLAVQEGITEVQAASWFMSCIHDLDELPMFEYCETREDFQPVDTPWASDVFADILISELGITWVDKESADGHEYVGGWLRSDLTGFFDRQGIPFPAEALAKVAATSASRRRQAGSAATLASAPAHGDVVEGVAVSLGNHDLERLHAELRALKAEVAALQVELASRPFTTRERNTLLTLIAALCRLAGIVVGGDKGAVGKIVRATELLGAPISDDTVRAKLQDIPEALLSCSK